MNRRRLLKRSALAAAASVLPRSRAADAAFKLNYLLGSAMYGDLPLATVIEETPKTGTRMLDIWPRKWATQREQMDEKQLGRVEAIICSMTAGERRDHTVINGSRRKRIARGSGTTVEEVNRVLKQFVEMRKMLKVMSGAAGGRKGRQRLMGMLRGMR